MRLRASTGPTSTCIILFTSIYDIWKGQPFIIIVTTTYDKPLLFPCCLSGGMKKWHNFFLFLQWKFWLNPQPKFLQLQVRSFLSLPTSLRVYYYQLSTSVCLSHLWKRPCHQHQHYQRSSPHRGFASSKVTCVVLSFIYSVFFDTLPLLCVMAA